MSQERKIYFWGSGGEKREITDLVLRLIKPDKIVYFPHQRKGWKTIGSTNEDGMCLASLVSSRREKPSTYLLLEGLKLYRDGNYFWLNPGRKLVVYSQALRNISLEDGLKRLGLIPEEHEENGVAVVEFVPRQLKLDL